MDEFGEAIILLKVRASDCLMAMRRNACRHALQRMPLPSEVGYNFPTYKLCHLKDGNWKNLTRERKMGDFFRRPNQA
jgi:hypothetical protein